MYEHPCEYCEGRVSERTLTNEMLRVGKDGFVILQDVPVGVCEKCGMRYYHASVLKRAEEAFASTTSSTRPVPVAPFRKAQSA